MTGASRPFQAAEALSLIIAERATLPKANQSLCGQSNELVLQLR
jgi:hypothetical protein